MYYINSLCVTLIIFYIISIYKNKIKFDIKDVLLIVVLYIVSTFVMYYIYSIDNTIINEKPTFIPETIDTGFDLH